MENEQFIEKVMNRRKAMDISQETIGEWLDITPTTVSQIESGNTELDIQMCLILAEKLNIPIEEIFADKKKDPVSNWKVIVLSALAAVLLLLNVVIVLANNQIMGLDSSKCYVVLNVREDYVELKERAPAVYDKNEPTFKIQREKKETDIWNDVADGDVVIVWYRSELSTKGVNSSNKIIQLKIANVLKVY